MNDHPQFVVYQFHFSEQVGRALHYVGSTTVAQFRRRMLDHASARGSRLTQAAIERDVSLTLVRVTTTDTRLLERVIKHNGHFDRYCHRCGSRSPDVDIRHLSFDALASYLSRTTERRHHACNVTLPSRHVTTAEPWTATRWSK